MWLLFLCAGLTFISMSPAFAAEEYPSSKPVKPVVLELFTSQSCGDTPPADRLVEELVAGNKNITVLTCHLNYFDLKGWKDTLSNRPCEDRRAGYKGALNISYTQTPQFVINGVYDTTGESDEAVTSILKTAQDNDTLFNIPLRLDANTLDITLPDMELNQLVNVWLFAFDRQHKVDIETGPNAGSTGTYVNVVRHLVKVLDWKGPTIGHTIDLKTMPADGYTVIAQYEHLGRIIGASTVLQESSIGQYQQ